MLCHMYSFSCPLVVINFPAGYAQCFQVFCSVFQSSVPVKPSLHPQDYINCPVYLLFKFSSRGWILFLLVPHISHKLCEVLCAFYILIPAVLFQCFHSLLFSAGLCFCYYFFHILLLP